MVSFDANATPSPARLDMCASTRNWAGVRPASSRLE
jgi:hypothetical protein